MTGKHYTRLLYCRTFLFNVPSRLWLPSSERVTTRTLPQGASTEQALHFLWECRKDMSPAQMWSTPPKDAASQNNPSPRFSTQWPGPKGLPSAVSPQRRMGRAYKRPSKFLVVIAHESRDTFYIFSSDVQNLGFGIIHSVCKYLLNTHFLPGKTDQESSLHGDYILVGRDR